MKSLENLKIDGGEGCIILWIKMPLNCTVMVKKTVHVMVKKANCIL